MCKSKSSNSLKVHSLQMHSLQMHSLQMLSLSMLARLIVVLSCQLPMLTISSGFSYALESPLNRLVEVPAVAPASASAAAPAGGSTVASPVESPIATTVASPVESPIAATAASTAAEIPPGADKDAWLLLKSAHDSRQAFPENFQGFDANLAFIDNDKNVEGQLSYRAGKETKIDLKGLSKEQSEWLQDKVLSMIGHRRGGDFSKRDGRNPITFGKDEAENNFGRLLVLNDSMNSTYRVKDNKVREVTRCPGDSRFTISVIETREADPGKYLANHFAVSYRDKKTNALTAVEAFRDSYKQVDGVWLPSKRTVISITPAQTTPDIRQIILSDPKVLFSN